MDNDFESLDRLYEALTLKRVLEPAMSPPCGGYNSSYIDPYRWTRGNGYDIVYYNIDRKYHRIYGPAYISQIYDIEEWYKDGKRHREGGPAVRHKKNELWFKDGQLHRLDGPAVITGGGPKEYWIDGQKLSPKEYKKEIIRRTKGNPR